MSRTLFKVTEETVARRDALIKELSNEIDRLRTELAEKDKRIARAMNLLDRALGDTDPDIEPDEHEDPVYWAMRALTGGSDE